MGSQGTAKGKKTKIVWQVEKRYQVVIDFMKPHQDNIFPIRIRERTPRVSQRNENRKYLTDGKT
jgi:hypothetical protein